MKKQLNSSQQKAVASQSKTILCLAGAGSGKTTVLTSRIARLNQEERVGCINMLALTFTRLAGKEMKERVENIIGNEARNLFCNTFHAFGVKILKEYGYLIELDSDFSIYDSEDREAIVETIIDDLGVKKDVLKSKMIKILDEIEELDSVEEKMVRQEYYYRMRANNAVDLTMLLTKSLYILKNFEVAKEDYRKQYEHIFVDEFQDTNKTQMDIIEILNSKNLFVVGDDFQSIYGWRGAMPEYIINFDEYYPDVEVIKLEDNYRSTEQIVKAANTLIKFNENQTDKKLIAHKTGDKISMITAKKEDNEAFKIASEILITKEFENYAVLARTNAKVQQIALRFKELNIPTEVITGVKDYLKIGDVKKVISLLKMIINPRDNIAFKNVINFPEKRLSKVQIEELEIDILTSSQESLFELMIHKKMLENFSKELLELKSEMYCLNALEAFEKAVKVLKLDIIYKEQSRHNKVEDLEKARLQIKEFIDNQTLCREGTGVEEFLKWIMLKDIHEKLIKPKKAVKIMTVHGSKGLEFETVFIVGLNQDTFPSKRGDLEEERRLMYVAVTRAREHLYFTRAEVKKDWSGKDKPTKESRFIIETIPENQSEKQECA